VLREMLTADAGLGLVDLMLLYFDKTSMATSLEVRVPFMDHRLVGFCASLPDDRLVWRLRRKELLRRAARGLVQDAIVDKPKRGFFHAAVGTWLAANHQSVVLDVLLDDRTRSRGQFRPEALAALRGGPEGSGKRAPQRTLCMLLLEKWQRMFVDSDGPAARLYRSADSDRPVSASRS
jgi:asparagine synthase (glutamine-hydrolysing)